MFTAQRFFVDQDHHIIDKLNPTAKFVWSRPEKPRDEMDLREAVLWRRLSELVGDLIINTNPMERSATERNINLAVKSTSHFGQQYGSRLERLN
jgi:hypothetical protein